MKEKKHYPKKLKKKTLLEALKTFPDVPSERGLTSSNCHPALVELRRRKASVIETCTSWRLVETAEGNMHHPEMVSSQTHLMNRSS